jgi:hypothetical protein
VVVLVTMPTETRRRRDELVLQVQRADDAVGVFAAASTRLHRLVPFDAAVWLTTDPGQSARYWEFLDPLGFTDELRAVLRVGDSPWGAINLFRRHGQAPFTPAEAGLVASLSAPLGEALRVRARPAGPPGGLVPRDPPGLLLFDRDGTLVSADQEARAWLAELPDGQDLPSDLGVGVPMWMLGTVFRALAVAGGRGDGTARSRVRIRRGSWLVCHASCLRDADGSLGAVAAVIEPAKAAEIAPILVQAYDLTGREQQITA